MNSPANDVSADDLDDLTRYLSSITAAQLPSWPAPVLDPESVARGRELAEAHCSQCHLPSGNGSAAEGTPSLNGQYQAYFLSAARDYRLSIRQDEGMYQAVSGLSDDELADLAAFYASLSGLHPSNAQWAFPAASSPHEGLVSVACGAFASVLMTPCGGSAISVVVNLSPNCREFLKNGPAIPCF